MAFVIAQQLPQSVFAIDLFEDVEITLIEDAKEGYKVYKDSVYSPGNIESKT